MHCDNLFPISLAFAAPMFIFPCVRTLTFIKSRYYNMRIYQTWAIVVVIICNITWQESSLIGQVYGKDPRYLTSSLFLIHIGSRTLSFPQYIIVRSMEKHTWFYAGIRTKISRSVRIKRRWLVAMSECLNPTLRHGHQPNPTKLIEQFYTSSWIHSAYLQRSLPSSITIFQPSSIDSSHKTNAFELFLSQLLVPYFTLVTSANVQLRGLFTESSTRQTYELYQPSFICS